VRCDESLGRGGRGALRKLRERPEHPADVLVPMGVGGRGDMGDDRIDDEQPDASGATPVLERGDILGQRQETRLVVALDRDEMDAVEVRACRVQAGDDDGVEDVFGRSESTPPA
jgi:hypothetical protein